MKMCKDYWYRYSDVAVRQDTALNFVNHTTKERDTPKAPPKKVTLVESMVQPRGCFLFDGVPVPRSEIAVLVPNHPHGTGQLDSSTHQTSSYGNCARSTAKNTSLANTISTDSRRLHPHEMPLLPKKKATVVTTPSTSTSPPFPSSSALPSPSSMLRQSHGAPETFHHLLSLPASLSRTSTPTIIAGHPLPTSSRHDSRRSASLPIATTTASKALVVTDKDPFPLWDKYPSRWETPVSERAQDRQQQSRQLAGQRYVHIYHEDNFVRVPTTTAVDHGEEENDDREDHSYQHHHQHHQKRRKPPHPTLEASMSTAQYYREKKKEEMFTRLALPAYAEHVSLQKRQFTPGLTSHVVATTAPSNDAHPSTSHHPLLKITNGTIEPHAMTKSKLVHILPIKG